MSCETVDRLLALLLYGELSFDEEEAVQAHLAECDACRLRLERERALRAALEEAALPPPPGLLDSCRQELASRLAGQAATPRSRLRRLWDWSAGPVPSWLLRPAGAVALVLLGFLAGHRFQSGPEAQPASKAPVAAQVSYLEPQPSGGVRIVVDEMRQRVVTGSLEDAATRSLLLQAAQAPGDPALRMDSLNLLARRLDSPEVRQVLLHALRNDPNPAVRLKAVDALANYGHQPEVRQALAEALLKDDNLGVRTKAVDLLHRNMDLGLAGVLQQVLAQEPNEYIRAQCRLMLEAIDSTLGTF